MAVKEEVYYEGAPHIGDLIISLLMSIFVITIPFGVAAIARALWVRYRITNRRITVTGGWRGQTRTDIVYAEIAKIVTVPRGLGSWGDMVLTLKDGSRLELKSLPKFRETYEYIESKLSLKAQDISGAIGGKA
ncbi:PH domain-containing protein [Pseudanabaena galeata UHCC 0370]|jgi:nitrogen fixation protein|uniref:PH domain-containing protein n=1 Tax=Pseudanabaena galeata UHCC 0370 TaxID=3110310 RepID=A0ABU5TM70_9CYAN|nr:MULTISPECIES: PH domain-containing protein [Pseudanabaena]MEA5479386.1 PH domain-containing protein [Pseudanabaena galeata UHCC 0370]MEA5486522.1 PH domain-containing protein [Pseudanabaena sp. CCNP1317]WGS74207.1 PH domain-containing protein [Pseudanabaena galeata CCNP1313]